MSLFNLSGVVLSMATELITITRFARDGYDSNGRAIARATGSTMSNIKVNVQPVSGQEMRLLPEGADASEWVSVWASTSMAVRDRLYIPSRSANFEVQHLDDWQGNGTYSKVMAKRLDATEPHP